MKKSTFAAMILGVIGGILFALGMCMALIPEWNAFGPGVGMGVIGAVVLFIMVLVWRKMENKEPVKLSGKTIGGALIGIFGALLFGVGISIIAFDLIMEYNRNEKILDMEYVTIVEMSKKWNISSRRIVTL